LEKFKLLVGLEKKKLKNKSIFLAREEISMKRISKALTSNHKVEEVTPVALISSMVSTPILTNKILLLVHQEQRPLFNLLKIILINRLIKI